MELIKNLKVKQKLFTLIIVFFIGFVIFGLIALLTLNRTRVNGKMYHRIIQGKDIIADILPPPEYIIESYLTVLQIFEENERRSSSSEAKIAELIKYGDLLKKEYETRHQYWLKALPEGEIKKLLTEDSYKFAEEFYEIRDSKFIPAIKDKNGGAISEYADELKATYANHRKIIDTLVKLTNAYNANIEEEANLTILLSFVTLIFVIFIIIVIICILFYKVSDAITTPILYIAEKMNQIANGHLSVDIEAHYLTNDEIGGLCKSSKATTLLLNKYLTYINEITLALNTIAEGNLNFKLTGDYHGEFSSIKEALAKISSSLSMMLIHIGKNSNQITMHSKMIAEGAGVISKGATDQAAATEEMLASITEMSALAKINSESAEKTSEVFRTFESEVLESDKKMHNLVAAIREISEASKEVYQIMDAINEIAHKTNLLAVNASIEAAHSGNSSTGFGVIASEIRLLSLQTTSATSEIEKLIKGSIISADHGVVLALDAAENLKEIVKDTQESAALISKMANDYLTQSTAIKELSMAIEEISKVVQENAAISEENASISATLYSQAEELNTLIAQFELCTE